MSRARIGIIGGTGLYDMPGVEDVREERVSTPYGEPSDAFRIGRLGGVEVVFLARHGRGHRFSPTEIPYRANVFGFKRLGVGWIVSVSAVGSLREDVARGHIVAVDQFIDRTWQRASTFFDEGMVGHASFADPVCPILRTLLVEAAREAGGVVHDGGTYVCMEGPAFSTRAESLLHRSWGATVIGMTNLPEAKLAREAGISYATLAMVTDYDCWHPAESAVSVEQILAVLQANADLAQATVRAVVPRILAFDGPPPQSDAMRTAVLTPREAIPPHRREALDVLLAPTEP
ncbi:MAG: S-methyl-5'-thioadenosine phosphorylase [Deltaproteobacteria bacterium]|nr:S-methyl-5'-thioadenosine phosphorylase [Deltaproteobacteria bacterium]